MALPTPSSSYWDNILPVVDLDASMYNFIDLFLMGANNVGDFHMYLLISSRAC